MMRYSNIRNAVMAFMLAFVAACTSSGDTVTAPVAPATDNTTGDATVAACCTVNPSNTSAVDTSQVPPVSLLVPYNAGTGTVTMNGTVSSQIQSGAGAQILTTDVTRILVLLDTDPGVGVDYEHIVADSGEMADPTATDATSDPDNGDFAITTVLTAGPDDDINPVAPVAGTMYVTVTSAATGALLIHCDETGVCLNSDGSGPAVLGAGPAFNLTYNHPGVVDGDIVTAYYRDGTGTGAAIGANGNNGRSISGTRTFRGESGSSGTIAGNNCSTNPATAVDDVDLTGALPGLTAALTLDDTGGAASIAGATWGVNAGGIFYPCSGIRVTAGGAGRAWQVINPIPVNLTANAVLKAVFLNSSGNLLGITPLQPNGTSTTVRASAANPRTVAGSPFLSALFISSDTAAPAITAGDGVAGGTGVLTTGLRQQPQPIASVSWVEANDDLTVGALSTSIRTAKRNLRASNVVAGDVVTIDEGSNLGAVTTLGAITSADFANVSPSSHGVADPIIYSASGSTYEIFHASATVSREREADVGAACTVTTDPGTRCVTDPNYNIVRADNVSVQGQVTDAGSSISTLRVTGANAVSGEQVEQTTVVSRNRSQPTHDYISAATNNAGILLVRRGAGDPVTHDCFEVEDTATPGAPAITTGVCAALAPYDGTLVTVDISGISASLNAITDNPADVAPAHLSGDLADLVNTINQGRPGSEEFDTGAGSGLVRMTTVRRGATASDTKLELIDDIGDGAGEASDPAIGAYGVSVSVSGTDVTVTVELPNVVIDGTADCDLPGNCPIAATAQGLVEAINNDTQASQHIFAQLLTDTNDVVEGATDTDYPALVAASQSIGTGTGALTAFGPVVLTNVPETAPAPFGAAIYVAGAAFCRDADNDGDFSDEACGLNAVSVYNGGGGLNEVTLNFAAPPASGAAITISYYYEAPAAGPFALQTDFFPIAPEGGANQTVGIGAGQGILITNNNTGEECEDDPGAPPADGVLECDMGGSGIIDYDTGEITVTFGGLVDATGVMLEYAHTGDVAVTAPNTIGVDDALGIGETDLYDAVAPPAYVTSATTGIRAALFAGESGATGAAVSGAEDSFDGGINCAVSGAGCPATITTTAAGRLSSGNPKIKVGIFDGANCLPSFLNPPGQTTHTDICFSAQMPLTEGTTDYEVRASDVSGNSATTAWASPVSRDTTPAFLDTDAGVTPGSGASVNAAVCETPEFDTMPICVTPADVNLSGQIETFSTTVSIGGKIRDFVAGTTVYNAGGTFPTGGESGRAYVRVTTDTPVTAGGANYDSFASGNTDSLGNPVPYVNGDAGADQGLFNYANIPLRIGGTTNVKVTVWDQAGNIMEFSTTITQISTATTTPPSLAIDCYVEDQPRVGTTIVPCQQDTSSLSPNTPAHLRLGTFGSPSEFDPVTVFNQVTNFVVYTNDGENDSNTPITAAENQFCNASFSGGATCTGATGVNDISDATFIILDDGLATVRLETTLGVLIEECTDTGADGSFAGDCVDVSGNATTGTGTIAYGVATPDIEVTFQNAAGAGTDVLVLTYTRDTLNEPVVAGEFDTELDAVVTAADTAYGDPAPLHAICLDGTFTVSTLGQVGGVDESCTDSATVVATGASAFDGGAECTNTGDVDYDPAGPETLNAPEFSNSLARGGQLLVSFSHNSRAEMYNNNFNTSVKTAGVGSYTGGIPVLDSTTLTFPADDNSYIVLGLAAGGTTVSGIIPGAPLVPGTVQIVTDPLGAPQIACDDGNGGWANTSNLTDCNAAVLAGNDVDDTTCAPFGAAACSIDYSTGVFTLEFAAAVGAATPVTLNAASSSRFGYNFVPPLDFRVVSSDRVTFRGRFLTLDNTQPDLYINEVPGLTASQLPAHGAMAVIPAYSFGFVASVTGGGGGTNQFTIDPITVGALTVGLPIDLPNTARDEAVRVGDYVTLTANNATVAANQGLYRITAISDDGVSGDGDGNCQNTGDTDGDTFNNADSDPCVVISVDRELPASILSGSMIVQAEYTWFTPAPLELENEGINSS